MRRTSLFLLLFAILATLSAQEGLKFQGLIENPGGISVVRITYLAEPFATQRTEVDIRVGDGGTFSTYLSFAGPTELTYSDGQNFASFYAEPDGELSFKYNSENFLESLEIEGKSRIARINQYLIQRLIKHDNLDIKIAMQEAAAMGDAQQYAQVIEEDYEKRLDLIDLARSDWDLPRDFAKTMQTLENCHQANLRLEFRSTYGLMSGEDPRELEIEEFFLNPALEIETGRQDLLSFQTYRQYLKNRVAHEASKMTNTPGEKDFGLIYSAAGEMLSGIEKVWVQGETIKDACHFGTATSVSEAWANYQTTSEAPSTYLRQIHDLYEKMILLSPGESAPEFNLRDYNGGSVSLASLEGKVVYIQFWASWSKPSLREMSASKRLKKDFAEEEVVFVYISLDDNDAYWHEMVEKLNLESPNLHARGFQSGVARDYAIEFLPNYFLIGRDGRIIHPNPPRPGDARLPEVLRTALAVPVEGAGR